MRTLLRDLTDARTHAQREKAFKNFREYVAESRPDPYDDDVTEFFLGSLSQCRWCMRRLSLLLLACVCYERVRTTERAAELVRAALEQARGPTEEKRGERDIDRSFPSQREAE
jgi:hypothetical protein